MGRQPICDFKHSNLAGAIGCLTEATGFFVGALSFKPSRETNIDWVNIEPNKLQVPFIADTKLQEVGS